MEYLAKLLFPNNPNMARNRKLQAMYVVVILVAAVCVIVGVMTYILSTNARP